MIKNTLAIAWKDLQLLLKDRGQLIGLFLTPVFFGMFYGMIFGSTAKFDVYLVNHDEGQYGSQMANMLYDIDVLDVTELETVEEADKKVADSEAVAAVIIPSDFSRDIEAFDPLNDPAASRARDRKQGNCRRFIFHVSKALYPDFHIHEENVILHDSHKKERRIGNPREKL